MNEPPTLLDAALEGEQHEGREAALRAAHDLGLSEDDPVWVIVRAIRESDRHLVERMETVGLELRTAAENLRAIEERMAITRVGFETLEAKITAGLEDIREMNDHNWDRCQEAIDMTRKMQRWLLGLLIGAIALWALASPAPGQRRESAPTAEEEVQRDE